MFSTNDDEEPNNEVFKLVEQWAKSFEVDPVQAIKKLAETYRDNFSMQTSILGLIGILHPEHSKIIIHYLSVGNFLRDQKRPYVLSENQKVFQKVRELVNVKLDFAIRLLHLKDAPKFEEHINEIIEHLQEFNHRFQIETASVTRGDANEKVFESIKRLQKNLNRLDDFITISNQDKILKEMASIKRAFSELDENIQEFIIKNF